ncbi:MAG TPA: iron ABC transporter permease [Myxococcota bacterium]
MKILTPMRVLSSLSALGAILLGALVVGLTAGPSGLGVGEIFSVLGDRDAVGPAADIVLRVRLPRVLLGALVGACLAVSGVLFQAMLRNPLADPYVLGVSGGAALGGILVLSLGSAVGLGYEAVPPAAFAGCLLTTAILYAIAGANARASTTSLLLTGVVFNAFASAAIVFLASMAGLTESASIFLWLIGSLSSIRVEVSGWVAAFLVLGLGSTIPLARSLNLSALGGESAEQLGVDIDRQRRIVLIASSLMVGAAVSVAGLIGFVGLMIPHLLRLIFGPDHRLLIPASALGGAAFLVICDAIARTILDGRELPVGAITALAGGPLFLWLLRRYHQRVLS